MYFGKDYVVGSDSRGTLSERNSFTDDVCKIVPVSKTVVFFGIGVTNVTGPVGFNVTDIARQISTEGMMLDQIGAQWGMLTAKALEKISAEHASALIDRNNKSNDIVGGWFAGAINGELSIYRAIVKLEDTSSAPLKFVVTGGYMKPTERISYFGSEKLSREFIENATPRAREANKIMTAIPTLGATRDASYIEALVNFVIRHGRDPGIGGTATVMISNAKEGVRWFRRPNFCPEQ